jgi:hypothetical protein
MNRHRNTNASGKPFDEATIQAVWEKTPLNLHHRPLKSDVFGSLMWREGYASTSTRFGWEIDHIKPVVLGGGDELENLQALQWENNRSKADSFTESSGAARMEQSSG